MANLFWDQWWSMPRKACLPWNSITALASSATLPAASKGAKGSLKRRTLQSVEQDTATSPLGAMETPRTGPASACRCLAMATYMLPTFADAQYGVRSRIVHDPRQPNSTYAHDVGIMLGREK